VRLTVFTLLAAFAFMPAFAQGTNFAFGNGHDSTLPVEVTSESLRVDQETGQAFFVGNVIAIQGELRLSADEVEVIYTEDQTEIETMIAVGHVVITDVDEAAESQHAIYYLLKDEIVMTDDVLVTQQGSTISGERMIIDLETNTGNMQGPVRTILTPRDDT